MCCCCTVLRCCCGCQDLRTGTMIWAVIDLLIVEPILIGLVVYAFNFPSFMGLLISCIVMMICDIILLIAAGSRIHCLCIFWMVWMVIHIIVMFIYFLAGVVLLGIWGGILCQDFNTYSYQFNGFNQFGLQAGNGGVQYSDGNDSCQYLSLYFGWGPLIALTILLPIIASVDIYFWVVVHSFFKEMERRKMEERMQYNNGGAYDDRDGVRRFSLDQQRHGHHHNAPGSIPDDY